MFAWIFGYYFGKRGDFAVNGADDCTVLRALVSMGIIDVGGGGVVGSAAIVIIFVAGRSGGSGGR